MLPPARQRIAQSERELERADAQRAGADLFVSMRRVVSLGVNDHWVAFNGSPKEARSASAWSDIVILQPR